MALAVHTGNNKICFCGTRCLRSKPRSSVGRQAVSNNSTLCLVPQISAIYWTREYSRVDAHSAPYTTLANPNNPGDGPAIGISSTR